MSKKQIIGLVIFLVLILIIVGIKFIGDKKDSVSGKDLTTVYVATGGGKEGLLHISKISEKRIEKVEDVLKEGDKFLVKVLDIDNQGKISLTKKGLGIEEESSEE